VTSARQRLFFALWPDAQTRQALAGLAERHLAPGDGRRVAAANLHLTLAFLGSVDSATRACAERAAQSVSASAFELELQCLGHWPRARILWSAPQETPPALTGLINALHEALRMCGHRPEARPFRAHVTLARKASAAIKTARHAPIPWPVRDFHLLVSESARQGVRYRALNRWPLK
jgi:RNA 2',3'-cyclic 3'-phosphodiesterase